MTRNTHVSQPRTFPMITLTPKQYQAAMLASVGSISGRADDHHNVELVAERDENKST